jgi:hypothetical protein
MTPDVEEYIKTGSSRGFIDAQFRLRWNNINYANQDAVFNGKFAPDAGGYDNPFPWVAPLYEDLK